MRKSNKVLCYLLSAVIGISSLCNANTITAQAACIQPSNVSTNKPGVGTVNTASSDLIVRSTPSTSGTKLTSLPKGSLIMIVGRSSDAQWYKVRYAKSKDDATERYGWVKASYIAFVTDIAGGFKVKTSGGNLNLHPMWGETKTPIGKIPNGTIIPHYARDDSYGYDSDYFQTVYADRGTGLVSASYLINIIY